MSTNSRIGILNKDGTVEASYCHWDGYPNGVGAVLHKHYTTEEKIRELIALGSISVLDASCEVPEGHTFDTPVNGYTIAYHRDRGEDWESASPNTYESEAQYYRKPRQPYLYLWNGTTWLVNGAVLDKYLSEDND